MNMIMRKLVLLEGFMMHEHDHEKVSFIRGFYHA